MKKIFAFAAAAVLSLNVFAAPSDWAVGDIDRASAAGYVPSELLGDYENNITRGEFARLAVNYVAVTLGYSFEEFAAYMSEGTHGYYSLAEPFGKVPQKLSDVTFADTDDLSVRIAACMGIVFGTGNDLFEADAPITREQAATMLLRAYYAYSGKAAFDTKADFADGELIDDWADLGVRFCLKYGVMKGVSDTMFDPDGFYTREQAIVTFARMSNDKTWMDSNADSLYPIKKIDPDAVISEFCARLFYVIDARYDSPYGTVLQYHLEGTPHGVSYGMTFVDTYGRSHNLYRDMPREGMSGFGAAENVSLSEDGRTFTFSKTYADHAGFEGVVFHEAGRYDITADLKYGTTEMTFTPMPVEKEPKKDDPYPARTAAITRQLSASNITLVDQYESGFGAVLYVSYDGGKRYAMLYVRNDGTVKCMTDTVPTVGDALGTPPFENIRFNPVDGSAVYFDVCYPNGSNTTGSGKYTGLVGLMGGSYAEHFVPEGTELYPYEGMTAAQYMAALDANEYANLIESYPFGGGEVRRYFDRTFLPGSTIVFYVAPDTTVTELTASMPYTEPGMKRYDRCDRTDGKVVITAMYYYAAYDGEKTLHEAGEYVSSFDPASVTLETTFTPLYAESGYSLREAAIAKELETGRVVLSRFDTPYGTVLYTTTSDGKAVGEGVYMLALIGNTGSRILLYIPTVKPYGMTAPVSNLVLGDYQGFVSYDVVCPDGTWDVRTHDPTPVIYHITYNLASLEKTQTVSPLQ